MSTRTENLSVGDVVVGPDGYAGRIEEIQGNRVVVDYRHVVTWDRSQVTKVGK